MSFSVQSTSVETAAVKRICRVVQRTKTAKRIAYAAVYACRKISGSSSWSQHSWGNAVDIFPKGDPEVHAAVRKAIRNTVVWQATHKTVANRGRKLDVAEVIDHSGRVIWTPSKGWHTYTGSTGDHVHVSGAPLKTGTPPCA
jgi:hypothetical protein